MAIKSVTALFIILFSFPTAFASDYTLKDFKYPQTDINFVQRAIELRKADTNMDFEPLFTQQPLSEHTTCGLTAEDIIAITAGMYGELDDSDKMSKLAKRNTGMDMKINVDSNINPQILSYSCAPDGKPTQITVRYNGTTNTEAAGFNSKFDSVNVKTVYYNADKLDYFRLLTFVTSSGNGSQPKPFLTSNYASPSTGEYISFINISTMMVNSSTLVYNQAITSEKTKIISWTDGNMVSIMNMKKGLFHGEFRMMDMKAKMMWSETIIPGWTKCYKNGIEVKTTGVCDAD